jgi:pyruvate carboxylase
VINPNLFVYGTLMSTAGHPMGRKLAREGKLLGPASINARLYRIARYPGAVDTLNAAERVFGELYALANPAASFNWLDAYEGLSGGPEAGEYMRVERGARLGSTELKAWVYLYQGHPDPRNVIADGRWALSAK